MSTLQESGARTLEALGQLKGAEHVPAEYLDFRTALLRAQLAACERLRDTSANAAVNLPLRAGVLRYDPDVLADVLAQTADSPGIPQATTEVIRKLLGHSHMLSDIADAAMFAPAERLPALSAKTCIDREALLFFGRAIGAPYASAAVHSPAAPPTTGSSHTGCPCCGSAPGLAMLCGDPCQRVLICSLCARQWPSPRLQCPFCARESVLETVADQADPSRWIDACTACRQYLKVIDARRPGESDAQVRPLVESVALLYLDVIAENEGCHRSLPYVAIR